PYRHCSCCFPFLVLLLHHSIRLFPYTTLFRSDQKVLSAEELAAVVEQEALDRGPDEMHLTVECSDGVDTGAGDTEADCVAIGDEDRKSTRLNSSHVSISYAVFCLKKKNGILSF